MSEILPPSLPAVPGLSLEAESGGRTFAAEAPLVLAGDGWEPSLLLLHSHAAAGLAETACKRSPLSAILSHTCRPKPELPTLNAALATTHLKSEIETQTWDAGSYSTVPMGIQFSSHCQVFFVPLSSCLNMIWCVHMEHIFHRLSLLPLKQQLQYTA